MQYNYLREEGKLIIQCCVQKENELLSTLIKNFEAWKAFFEEDHALNNFPKYSLNAGHHMQYEHDEEKGNLTISFATIREIIIMDKLVNLIEALVQNYSFCTGIYFPTPTKNVE